jgi:hypothetical protein
MKKFATSFCLFSSSCWILGALGYLLLAHIMPDGYVFGSWPRMFEYHYQHPYQYILVVAVAYGLVASAWARFLGHPTGWKRILSIVGVIEGEAKR